MKKIVSILRSFLISRLFSRRIMTLIERPFIIKVNKMMRDMRLDRNVLKTTRTIWIEE
jgi:hypothetical protein